MTESHNNITVIGIGKLGLGFALLLEKSGYNVVGVDIFPEYVQKLNQKNIRFTEPSYDDLLQNSANFQATTNLQDGIDHSNIIFIIVQTPNGGGTKFYDHTILSNLLDRINQHKPQNKHFIIGCTVMPTYIDHIATTLIPAESGCTISYNPEFIAQGEIVKGFENPDMILVGTREPYVRSKLQEVYSKMAKNQPVFCFMTPVEAEIVKISLNGFVTTKISFANMISDLCDQLGADKTAVLYAVGSDTRIGRKYFKAGLSFGGPCFPRDTKALKQLMDQHQIPSNILKATTEYNEEHNRRYAEYLASDNPVLKQVAEEATGAISSADTKADFIFQNVCYKEGSNIPIIEESAKLKIAEILVKQYNKRVTIKDTHEIIKEVQKEYGKLFSYST
jgi:nucleotide sugar dehydrogenase